MVGCDSNVRHSDLHEAEKRREHASDCAYLTTITVVRRWHGVVVTEEFVGAVDEVNVQARFPDRSISIGASRLIIRQPVRRSADVLRSARCDFRGVGRLQGERRILECDRPGKVSTGGMGGGQGVERRGIP